jgi:amino acid transporter
MKSKAIFAVAALLFCAGIIVWLLLYGKADNSLHSSALSWAFCIGAGVLAGVGFGAVAHLIPGAVTPQPEDK